MKNKKIRWGIKLGIALVIFLPLVSLAQNNDYQLLAPLPGFEKSYAPSNFGKYVESMIYLAIVLAALLAVANIVWGGVRYMTGETLGTKQMGKEQIQRSVVGLLILCASFLILNTINPYILNFQLDVSQQNNNSARPASYQLSDILKVSGEKRAEFEKNPSAPVEFPYGSGTDDELKSMRSACQQATGGTKNDPIRDQARKVYICT